MVMQTIREKLAARLPKLRDEMKELSAKHGEVKAGEIEVLPLAPKQSARLELSPSPGIDVGRGKRGSPGKTTVEGGTVGLIIDARGRPLALPEDADSRQQANQAWLWSVGA